MWGIDAFVSHLLLNRAATGEPERIRTEISRFGGRADFTNVDVVAGTRRSIIIIRISRTSKLEDQWGRDGRQVEAAREYVRIVAIHVSKHR